MGRTHFPPPEGATAWPPVAQWTPDHWRHWVTLSGGDAETYLRERYRYGVGTRLRTGALGGRSDKITYLYLPTPKQVQFHKCQAPNLLYGGAAGGAKSHGLRWDAYMRCLQVPSYRCLLLRRLWAELKETHIDQAEREAPLLGAKCIPSANPPVVKFGNDSAIIFGHCQNPGDEQRYLSTEYDWIGFDEFATFEEAMSLEIMSRARSTKPGVTPLVRATSNPGGSYTLWVVARFIDKTVDEETDPFYDPTEWAYIPSRLYDNPFLMDPDGSFHRYEKRLGPLPPERRRQLLEGDWSAITGQFFPEFRTTPSESHPGHVHTWPVPVGATLNRWIDWGYNAPGCCLLAWQLPDGRLYLHRELKFQGVLAAEVAKTIARETRDLLQAHPGTRLGKTIADPSMWNEDGKVAGESYASTFGRHGVGLSKGNRDRINGWGRVRAWLESASDGYPWLIVDPSCKYFIRTFPRLVSSESRPEDVDSDGDDHAADALRYGLMAGSIPYQRTEPTRPPPGSPAEVMAEARQEAHWERQRGLVR